MLCADTDLMEPSLFTSETRVCLRWVRSSKKNENEPQKSRNPQFPRSRSFGNIIQKIFQRFPLRAYCFGNGGARTGQRPLGWIRRTTKKGMQIGARCKTRIPGRPGEGAAQRELGRAGWEEGVLVQPRKKRFQSESWRTTAALRSPGSRGNQTNGDPAFDDDARNQETRLERAVPAPPPGRLEMANMPHWVTISRNWRFIDSCFFFLHWSPCTVSGLAGGWQCFHRQQCRTFCPHGLARAVFTKFNERTRKKQCGRKDGCELKVGNHHLQGSSEV